MITQLVNNKTETGLPKAKTQDASVLFVKEKAKKLRQSQSNKRLDSMDWFGAGVSSFNFEGRRKMHSFFGVTCTIIFKIILLSIICMRVIKFVSKSGPNILYLEHDDQHISEKTSVQYEDDGFQFAFVVRDYITNDYKSNSSMV